MKLISYTIVILIFTACGKENSSSGQNWYGEEEIINYERHQFELNINNLHKLNFIPPKIRKNLNWKTRTILLKDNNEIIQRDSFNQNGVLISSIDRRCQGADSISLNEYGLIDTIFLVQKDRTQGMRRYGIPIKIIEYFEKDGIVYRIVFDTENGTKEEDYFYFEQFKYQDLLLSKTYHWSLGGSGEHIRYYYSNLGELDSLRSYRGPDRFKTMVVDRIKSDTQIIETIIEENGDTISVKIFNAGSLLIEEREYWKPNPYQKAAYQKVYSYIYDFYEK